MDLTLATVTVGWDYQRYVHECTRRCLGDGMGQKELKLAKTFKRWREELTTIVSPKTVVDSQGHILVWVLPDLLSKRIQVRDVPKMQRRD